MIIVARLMALYLVVRFVSLRRALRRLVTPLVALDAYSFVVITSGAIGGYQDLRLAELFLAAIADVRHFFVFVLALFGSPELINVFIDA